MQRISQLGRWGFLVFVPLDQVLCTPPLTYYGVEGLGCYGYTGVVTVVLPLNPLLFRLDLGPGVTGFLSCTGSMTPVAIFVPTDMASGRFSLFSWVSYSIGDEDFVPYT